MRTINEEHTKKLIRVLNESPYFQLLGMKMTEIGKGTATLEVDIEKKHNNPFGGVHGGVYASLVDTIAYWAAYYEWDEHRGATGQGINVDFVSGLKGNKVWCKGELIKAGRSLCLCQATIYDEEGRILAHGTERVMLLDGKQTMKDAFAYAGVENMPPKFIES